MLSSIDGQLQTKRWLWVVFRAAPESSRKLYAKQPIEESGVPQAGAAVPGKCVRRWGWYDELDQACVVSTNSRDRAIGTERSPKLRSKYQRWNVEVGADVDPGLKFSTDDATFAPADHGEDRVAAC